MECPNCQHQAASGVLVKCSHCGNVYERQVLEEYEHIGYLLRWLDEHHTQLGENADSLETDLVARRAALEKQMHIERAPAKEAPPPAEVAEPALVEPATPTVVEPAPVEVVRMADILADTVENPTVVEPASVEAVPVPPPTPEPVAAIPEPVTAPRPTPVPAPAPVRPPSPPQPPRPARPPVNWGKIWDNAVNFVVSGALLRAVLYMGAFMIVVSAAVLVINFWDIFPPVLQIAFIFALPTAFYVGGWLTRTRLKLLQAGMVITGVGAILLAVDFAALYQLADLNISINLYWLIASLITTPIYIFTAYRLKGEFFDYLMLLSGVSILLALARVLNASLEWTLVTVPLSGAGMAGLAAILWPRGDPWHDMARASRYLPQVLMPIGLFVVLFVGGPHPQAGQMTAFLCAAVAYGLLAWKFPSVLQLGLLLVSLAVTTWFGVWLFDTTGLWLPTAGALLSAGYILTGWKFFKKGSAFELSSSYRQTLYGTGFILTVPALFASLGMALFGKTLEAAIPLTLLALSFCTWHLLLRQPFFGYVGSVLGLVPFWLWLDLADVQFSFYPLSYLLLISLAYLPAGIFSGKIENKFAAPFKWTGWLVSGIIFFASFILRRPDPVWSPALTLTLLGVYYAFNTWYFRQAVFAWGTALVLPLALAQWLGAWVVPTDQAAPIWAGLAFAYLFFERFLNQRKDQVWAKLEFRLPFGLGIIVLAFVGLAVSLVAFIQVYEKLDRVPLTLTAQGMLILLAILAARLYHSRWPLFAEPPLSALLAALFFVAYSTSLLGISLEWFQYGLVFCGVAWLHLLIAAGLDSLQARYSHGLYLGGYGFGALAVLWTIVDLPALLWTLGAFVVAMIASAALTHFNRHRTWNDFAGLFGAPEKLFVRLVRGGFLWPAAWLFPIWSALLLIHLEIPVVFRWLGFSLPALLYLAVGHQLAKREATYSWSFFSAAHVFVVFALLFSIDRVLALSGQVVRNSSLPYINRFESQVITGQGFVQLASFSFYVAWAWMKRQRIFAHVAAWLSILPFTSFLLTLPSISAEQIVIAWAGWAAFLMLAGFLLDRTKEGSPRHAHGPYLAGYALAVFALLNSMAERWLLIVVLGMCIVLAALSAVAAHFNRHRTWDDFARLFGAPGALLNRLVRSAFLWPVAWLFPLWCGLLLIHLEIPLAFRWLGLSVPALLYLPLGTQLAKRESTYTWSFFSAGHVFVVVALFFSVGRVLSASSHVFWGLSLPTFAADEMPVLVGQGIVQLVTVAFYAAWAWLKRQRFFAHVAAWLSILPFTSLLLTLAGISAKQIVIAWTGWAIVLMLTGFLLDRTQEGSPRHAHGPYLTGYALAVIALSISTAERWLNVIVLGMCILAAGFSFVAMHFKQHRTFDDFVNFFWRKDTLIHRGARLLFLFFAAYALPVWMMQLEAYHSLSPAWQGVSLALLAPLFIASGLFLRRINSDYTWPFYSAGYALTALGAMIAFDDQRLAIYVLALDVVVYAASSVIFRQPFWLYLATCLTPITVLITLHYNDRLTSQWIAWVFSGLGFLYFGLGQFLDRHKAEPAAVAPFAMPLYAPGYLLSAIALALALASGDRFLALGVFPVNILLYALSAWRLREPLFLYPAAWLSIVPYYLFVTTYFTVPFEWQGLAWLPLILVLIGLGRFAFHKEPLDLKTPRAIFVSLAHPAVPFYSIAYALTVTMLLGSRWTPVSLTIACATATVLYFASALLFRHPAWLYPTLFTAHLTIIAYFTINPSGSPARFITLPFLALTWLEALAGYFVSRRYPVTEMTASGKVVFKFLGREFDFGAYPSIGFLTVPSWAQPIFIVVVLDTLLWESLALGGLDTGAWVSAGFFLLFALFAMLWQDQLLAYFSLGFGILAASVQLRAQEMATVQIFASLSGLAFGLYLLSWLVEWLKGVLAVWRRPLVNVAVALSVVSIVVTLPTLYSETVSAALTLGFVGALYLTMSLRRRTYLLGYLGMGLLIAGWSLFLFVRNVEQPQFYAIPAGLYFTGMGFFERARRPGRFALLIESLGLALLLVTSFAQSLNGETGFPYFLLLLVEGLLVVWWGAARRLRVPFVIGLTASVINVLAQVVVLVRVYDVNRWIIIFGVGILLVGLGIFVERRREMLLARAQEFRDMLERWD